ncbi:hypothetical protein [Halopelagius fulvigenes]|uniref:Tail assembly chaperone n=1 Tax=Halopelagius fulvigenes TaxID=1198324 RepID=A0ABD5U199_9EURY
MTDTNDNIRTDGGAQVDNSPEIGPDYDNPETAQKAREMAQEKLDEKKAEAKKNQSIKQQLEQAADEETIFVPVFEDKDLEVEFSTLSTNEATRLMAISEEFEAIDEGEVDAENEGEIRDRFREMVSDISEILGDKAVDESLSDPDWWSDTLSLMRLITVAQGLIAEDDSLSAEDIDDFR